MKNIVKTFVKTLINALRSLVNNEAASYVMAIGAVTNLAFAIALEVTYTANMVVIITFLIECMLYVLFAFTWIIGTTIDNYLTNKEFADERHEDEVQVLNEIAMSMPIVYSSKLINLEFEKSNAKQIKSIIKSFLDEFKDNEDLCYEMIPCVAKLTKEDADATLESIFFDCEIALDNLKDLKD